MSRPLLLDDDPVTIGVLRALADGATDQEAAERVHVSPRTVQRVLDHFREQSGARSRFAAGVAACRMGLLDDRPRRPEAAAAG